MCLCNSSPFIFKYPERIFRSPMKQVLLRANSFGVNEKQRIQSPFNCAKPVIKVISLFSTTAFFFFFFFFYIEIWVFDLCEIAENTENLSQ